MLQKIELAQILRLVAKRWDDIADNPQSMVMRSLPDTFWMNSAGGKAGKGRWVTAIMYTENAEDAESFKKVLLRWQASGAEKQAHPDLVQIKPSQD